MAEISRRSALTILGAGAAAAATGGVVSAAASAHGSSLPQAPGPDNPTRVENRRAGTASWRIGGGDSIGADDLGRQVAGYASATSVDVGSPISFHVSTSPARDFAVAIYRLGYYGGVGARQLTASPTLHGSTQPLPATDHPLGMITCSWSPSWTLTIPQDWTSGAYLAAFTTSDGHRSVAPFVVRDDARVADFLVVLPFSTYQAYNQWPLDGSVGKSLYYGYGSAGSDNPAAEGGSGRYDVHGKPVSYGDRARTVAFARPYSGVGLPQRIDIDYEFLQWAERSGYDVAYATSVDVHQAAVDPSRYSALVFSGHDEYWSREMRDTVSAALGQGTHLAYMAANNVYWHVRFADHPLGGPVPVMACYKSDPDPGQDASGPTCLWREVSSNGSQSEQQLLGVQYNGIPREEMPLSVSNPGHWFWAGTGVRDGELIPGIVGGEADGFYAGAPQPESTSHTLLSASHYMALGGSNWPRVQHTSLYETARGAVVFDAATFNWSFGLNRAGYVDTRIQRATANLFNRMRQRAA